MSTNFSSMLQTALTNTPDVDDQDLVAMEDIDVIMAQQETEAELNALEAALTHIANTAIGLEGLVIFAEGAQAKGGMDSDVAAAVMAGADGMLTAFGGLPVVPSMPALEAFEGDGGRAVATGAALEGLVETVKALWERFMNFLKETQKKVMKWLDENLSNAARLQKSAQALSKKAADAKGSPKETKLTVAGGQYLAKGGKVSTVSASDVATLSKYMTETLFNSQMVKAGQDFSKTVNDVDSSEIKGKSAKAFLGQVSSIYNTSVQKALGLTSGTNGITDKRLPKPANGETVATAKLPLGDAFIATVQKDTQIARVEFFGSKNPESKEKIEAPALDRSGIIAVADAVADACGALVSQKKSSRDIEALNKDVEKAGSKMLANAKKNDEGMTSEAERSITSLVEAIRNVTSNQMSLNRDLLKQANQTLGAAYSFARASLSNLKEEK